jgi:hypothetical protein
LAEREADFAVQGTDTASAVAVGVDLGSPRRGVVIATG